MLFNSPEFLIFFLPIVLAGFFLIARLVRPSAAILWLVIASLFFYAWWKLEYLVPLLISVGCNFCFGLYLAKKPSKWVLAIGITGNIAALAWFKYAGFLAQMTNDLVNVDIPVPQIVLPLAISFFTFQQIAYLVDAYSGEARETSFSRYALFVVFFPQLIAGPIVHHKEVLTKIDNLSIFRLQLRNFVLGLTGFTIGLCKKVLIADPLSGQTQLAFGPAADGLAPGFADAWLGGLAFTLQLYFDFSGYSDMAIGLALMFGIRLPLNFSSPFKAASIIEFWRRWHITLTRFLTSYIYNPLVIWTTRRRLRANKPLLQRSSPKLAPFLTLLAVPTLITMGLAGIWHGAGWQFVVFGFLHGIMLVANHAWLMLRRTFGFQQNFGWIGRAVGVAVTFLAVTVSLVFFKSASLEQALKVVQGMAGLGGEFVLNARLGGLDWTQMSQAEALVRRLFSLDGSLILIGLLIIWITPNTAQWVARIESAASLVTSTAHTAPHSLSRHLGLLKLRTAVLQPVLGIGVGVILSVAVLRALSVAPTEFLYFTF